MCSCSVSAAKKGALKAPLRLFILIQKSSPQQTDILLMFSPFVVSSPAPLCLKTGALNKTLSLIHILLHSTSSTNAAILDELLTKWEEMGYHFASLDQLAKRLES